MSLAFENAHHASAESRGIARPKRHDGKARFVSVGSEGHKLLLILMMGADLMAASFVVQSDEKEIAIRVAQLADSAAVSTRSGR